MNLLHDAWARAMDGFSFGFINALQMRGKGGSHTAEEWQVYREGLEKHTLESFYAVPEDVTVPELMAGNCRCPSPLPSDCPENNHVHMDVWPGPKGWKSPAMFMLHGFMSVSDVGYRMWAKKLNSLGWTAVFFHLPYHYGRRPKGVLSGEMALTSNIIRTAEGLRQAVVELRMACRLFADWGAPHVGLWGTSYGGWVASLVSLLEPSVRTTWLLEPIVDVDEAVWVSPASRTLRAQLRRRGITREEVKKCLPLFCPTHHKPLVPEENIMLLAGTFDRVAPPEVIRKLHTLWPKSHYEEFRQGHVGYQLMPESLRLAQERMPWLFEV